MFDIEVLGTPNPDARKFVLGFDIISNGKKASFNTPLDCTEVPLAGALLDIQGVVQVYFFENFITITKVEDFDWDPIEEKAVEILQTMLDSHDPDFTLPSEESKRQASYENMPKELREINEILDRHIRPALQMDGGDLQVLKYDEQKRVFIHYEGACGGCPTSTSGTLYSIEGILRDEIDPEIVVLAV